MKDSDTTVIVKPLLDAQEESLVRQTLEACRTAAQNAFPLAKRIKADTASRVRSLATLSLAPLPEELAESVAESVAHEVKTGEHDGTKGSCRLSWGCVVLRKNLRLRLMVVTGQKLRGVRVRDKDETQLNGMRIVSPSYLMPDPDGGFLLKLTVKPDVSSGTGHQPFSTANPCPSNAVPTTARPTSCGSCGGSDLKPQWDGQQYDWYCEGCKSFE